MSNKPPAGRWLAPVWLLVIFGLLSAISLLIPPLQSPDEHSHLMRAAMLARGQWLLQLPPADAPPSIQGNSGGWVDVNLVIYTQRLTNSVQGSAALASQLKAQVDDLHPSDQAVFYPVPGTGYYFPLIYAPQVLGLLLGDWLNLPIAVTYQLIRSITLLMCLGIMAFACRILPPNPMVLAIATLPMGLFQLVSPTIDGMTAALSILTISLFLRQTAKAQSPNHQAPWGLYCCIFILATSRTHLLPLLLLPLYLACRQYSTAALARMGLLTLLCLTWVLFALASTSDLRVVRAQSTSELLRYYATDPLAFIRLVWHSVSTPEVGRFYLDSFIGILGWLDTRMSDGWYKVLGAGLTLAACVSVSWRGLREDWAPRAILLGIATASAFMVFLAMTVTWTPHPAEVIQGVQGRYFTVPALLLGYALSGQDTGDVIARRTQAKLVAVLMVASSLIALTTTLINRYHWQF